MQRSGVSRKGMIGEIGIGSVKTEGIDDTWRTDKETEDCIILHGNHGNSGIIGRCRLWFSIFISQQWYYRLLQTVV